MIIFNYNKREHALSEWKIEICFFTLSCRIDLCLITIFITNFEKPQKKLQQNITNDFNLSRNKIDIFSWVKMELRFSVRTVCSLFCELSHWAEICDVSCDEFFFYSFFVVWPSRQSKICRIVIFDQKTCFTAQIFIFIFFNVEQCDCNQKPKSFFTPLFWFSRLFDEFVHKWLAFVKFQK